MVDQIKRELNEYLGKIKRLLEKKDMQAQKAQNKNAKAAIEIEAVLIDNFAMWVESKIELLSSCIIQDQGTITQLLDSKEDVLLKKIEQLEAQQSLIDPDLLSYELWARKPTWEAKEVYEYLKAKGISPEQAYANFANLANSDKLVDLGDNKYKIRVFKKLN